MRYAVNFTRRAEIDLDLIFIAIDAENSEAALKWYFSLHDALLTLETHPSRCPLTTESRTHRHLLFGRRADIYRVIFQVSDETQEVTIAHIRHGARKPFTAADLN